MTASLSTLITTVQGLLSDIGGTSYPTTTCTSAIRQTLQEFNQTAPRLLVDQLVALTDQHEYELIGGDFVNVQAVLSVYLFDDDGDDDTPLNFTYFSEDSRMFIRLETPQEQGKILLIGFSAPHTINGIDSATESTIPTIYDQVIVSGGAYYSICIRSVGRVEPINLNRDVPRLLRDSAQQYLLDFLNGKRKAGNKPPRPAKLDQTWPFNPTGF